MSVVTVVSQDAQASCCHQDDLVLAPLLPSLARSQKRVPRWACSVLYMCYILYVCFTLVKYSYLMLD